MLPSPAIRLAPTPGRPRRAVRVRRVVVALLGSLGLLAAVGGQAQNLLPNPDLALDASGWVQSGAGSVVYDGAGGWPLGVFSPGSLLVTNDGVGWVYGTSPCIPLSFAQRDSFYLASLHVFAIPAAGITSRVSVTVVEYGSNDCSGLYSGGGFNTEVASGIWSRVKSTRFLDSNTGSVRFEFGVTKTGAGTAQVRIDGLYLGHWVKGDFNQDGYADLVHRNVNGNDHQVWLMGGTWRDTSPALTPDVDGADWQLAVTDDFDGDGKTDVIVRNVTSGEARVWKLNGTTRVGEGTILTPGPDWDLVASADFGETPVIAGGAHDGKPDLLWRNRFTQKLLVWTMDGLFKTGEIVPSPDQAADANWSVAAALDFNADGEVDLLWYNASTGKVVIWFMNSSVQRITGTFTTPANAGSNEWKVVAAGDYGRGAGGVLNTPDIVWRNSVSGKLVVWHMNQATRTSGVFTSPDAPFPALGWTVAGPK